MNKILGLFLIFAFVALVSAFNYDFQVSLSPVKNKDGNLNGTLKVYVGVGSSVKFLRLNETYVFCLFFLIL